MPRIPAALFLSFLSLPLFAAITGTVTTTDGTAIAGARVSIHSQETSYARRSRLASSAPEAVPLASTQTDEKGSFTLASPKEPVADLRVEMPGYEPFVRRVERDEVVPVALWKTDTVKGSVTANGKPVANALVMLGADYVTRSDERGQYEAPAIKPPYILAVVHPDYAIDEELLLTGVSLERELARTLSAGVALSGRAVAANGTSPVAGAEIWLDDWPVTVSGADGTFTIAHAPADWKVITARKGMLTGTHTAGGAKTINVRLEPSAVLSGRVLDAKTKAPVAGATVGLALSSLSGMVAPMAFTDASGAYSIAVPAGESQWVSSRHPAYVNMSDSMKFSPGQQAVKDFALQQLAQVSGVVVDQTNKPMIAARVASRDAFDRGIPDMPANGAMPVTSGPDGKFTVRVLPGAGLYLRASKTGWPQGRGDVMKLAAGERKSDVVLTIPTGVLLKGRVLDASGKPLSGVAVIAGPAPAPGEKETLDTFAPLLHPEPVRTGEDGTFSMRVSAGWHHFTFKRDGYLRKQLRGQRVFGAADGPIEARLEPASEIGGRVMRGGVGVADVEVSSYGATDAVATTGPDGSFVLGGFAPGVKELELRKREELIINEKRMVTAPVRGAVIEVRPGGTIRGRVVEKGTTMPVRSFRAGVMIGPGDMRTIHSEDGTFTIEHVPAGVTTVAATAHGYFTASKDLKVVENETVTDLVLEIEPGVRLSGTVTDASGAPVSGVTIAIRPPSDGGMIGGIIIGIGSKPEPPRASNTNVETVTDANGRYALVGLVPGEEIVHFTHPAFAKTTRTIKLEDREAKLDVQLSAPQR